MLPRMIDIVEALVIPSGFCFLILAVGLLLCLSARTRKAGVIVLAFGTIALMVFSSGKTATLLTSPLEYEYPRVPDQPAPVKTIVVLAAYAAADPNMSLSDRPNYAALYRINEGVLLWRRCQDCTVIVTGSPVTTTVMSELLSALGVPREKVELDTNAVTTSDSAINLRGRLGQAPFYLVTSAVHMPRSMGVFLKAGLHPLAAPTDHRLPKRIAQAQWAPTPFHLECSDAAVHERVGVWWYRMRGLI